MDATDTATDGSDGVSITVMERGSQWPERASVIPSTTSENIVMVQGANEFPDAFAARVTGRLDHVRATGRPLKSAMLLATCPLESSLIAHGRLAATASRFLSNAGTLTLVGDEALPLEARAELAGIAPALSEFLGPDRPVLDRRRFTRQDDLQDGRASRFLIGNAP